MKAAEAIREIADLMNATADQGYQVGQVGGAPLLRFDVVSLSALQAILARVDPAELDLDATAVPGPIPGPVNPADPVSEGLAVVVMTGLPGIQLLACAECGVLLWDAERHWRDGHANRLAALRSIAAREAKG